MQRITRDQAQKFVFDWRDKPLLRVQPGESFEIETRDAGSGFFKTAADKAIPANRPGFDQHPPLANPIGGPVFVDGAKKGDVLIVEIEDILVGDRSWVAVGPGRGPLGQATDWPGVSQQYTTMVFEHSPGPSGTMRDGALQFNDTISWPLSPFIGTIGVAPEREVVTSIDGQGAWGGNLDIRDVATGSRVHLPVFHTGALFYLGDVHASQGDTEYCGTAAETCATVRLRFQLVKRRRLPFMRIEKEKSIIAVQAARPLETAVDGATQLLMSWLVEEYSFTETEAYCLVSTCPDFRINIYQMLIATGMDYVAGAELPRNLLG
ncbi:MAG TPA: acetamidase/formamidase family protein [Verrucomicrobiota bacterium]|nr:acetamidase/formamidase family protein [Verrucomicrobiota bacterium]